MSRAVAADDRAFRSAFFKAVSDEPLEPDDARYVPFYEGLGLVEDDPVNLLADNIEFTSGRSSVQLLSGFRGSGKSTQLRRLRARLREQGYTVVLFDIEDYLNLSSRVDVSDFLLAVAGAFGDTVVDEGLLPDHPAIQSYWERFVGFVRGTKVEVSEISAGLGAMGLKANLRRDPDFTRRLQDQMAGHLGAFVEDVRDYIKKGEAALRESRPHSAGVVLIVDSMEHIRGTSANAKEVQDSVETVFAVHADKLQLPLHAIYTVPAFLRIAYKGLGALYNQGMMTVPSVKVRGPDGQPLPIGRDALEQMVAKRGDWQRLLGTQDLLDHLIFTSGGHLRDLLRMVAEVIRRADTVPVDAATVERAVSQIRSEYLPIADADARWLWRIAQTHEAALENMSLLPALVRFFDTQLVLVYRNGLEWYDVHPIIRQEVERQVAELEARAREPTPLP